jgi:hypothetical protein
MSIKQNGGVFGRNPTFNDVTIDGTLTFDGDIDINSDLKIDGDLEVTGTSKLTGSVNVGTSSPLATAKVHLEGPAGASNTTLYIPQTSSNVHITTSSLNAGTKIHDIQWYGTPMASLSVNSGGNGINWDLGFAGEIRSDTLLIKDVAGTSRAQIDSSGLTINTGNLVIGTSGKGIDFSATAGTGTSELLDDYEEGTWTPVLSVGLTVVGTPSFTGTYTKIGNTVTAIASLTASTSVAAIGGSQMVNGLPYSVSGVTAGSMTNGNLNEGVNVAGYLDRIYALASTAAAPSLVATIVYKV